MLDRHLLLAFPPVAVEDLDERGIGPAQLVGLVQVLAAALEGLFLNHRAAIALH
ncbi:hypothetical protein [Methylocystis echinoides]|uniref:hypothetical protein n=1 Tax=Methylocystis echinoides TaxID=29468 RepID=UPI0032E7FD76